jgi:hypothetical protein
MTRLLACSVARRKRCRAFLTSEVGHEMCQAHGKHVWHFYTVREGKKIIVTRWKRARNS